MIDTTKPNREDLQPDEVLCDYCPAKCCRYFALPIETPTSRKDFEFIRWYLLHDRATVFTEDDEAAGQTPEVAAQDELEAESAEVSGAGEESADAATPAVVHIEQLGEVMQDASICGLGQAAPNPLRCARRIAKVQAMLLTCPSALPMIEHVL